MQKYYVSLYFINNSEDLFFTTVHVTYKLQLNWKI